MGRLILISGPNGSGKSRYAEALVARMPGARCYIATMQVCTGENLQRVRKHQLQRAGLNFETLERPCRLQEADIPPDANLLLEDVSNLLANTLFEAKGSAEDALNDILFLLHRCRTLTAVTIAGLSTEGYTGETAAYIQSLNSLNQTLLERADAAVMLIDGRPVCQKGRIYDFA